MDYTYFVKKKKAQSIQKKIRFFPHSCSSIYSANVKNQDFRGVIPEDFRMLVIFNAMLQNPVQFLSSEEDRRIPSPLGGGHGN